jgi:hypothetical protein
MMARRKRFTFSGDWRQFQIGLCAAHPIKVFVAGSSEVREKHSITGCMANALFRRVGVSAGNADGQTGLAPGRHGPFGKEVAMKPLSVLHWYNVLRSHYRFTTFEAIRFALWLAR